MIAGHRVAAPSRMAISLAKHTGGPDDGAAGGAGTAEETAASPRGAFERDVRTP
jgi:hypothetical protein